MKHQNIIPETKSGCAIAFSINKDNELFYIGDYEKVKEAIISGTNNCEYHVFKRKIGSMINDYEDILLNQPEMNQVKEVWTYLSDNIKFGHGLQDSVPTTKELEGLYISCGDNVLWKYILMVIYNQYFIIHHKGAQKINISKSNMFKHLEKFYNDFCEMVNSVLLPFSNVPPIYENQEGFYNFLSEITGKTTFCVSIELISKHVNGELETYYIAKDAISPIIFVYWDVLCKSKLYVRRCQCCNRLVVTNRNQSNVICHRLSCKRLQLNTNTKSSRAKKSKIPYETQYSKTRSYWNNSKRKLIDQNLSLEKYEKEFQKFREEGKRRKSLLNPDSSSAKIAEFNTWLISQEKECDLIIDKILIQSFNRKEDDKNETT